MNELLASLTPAVGALADFFGKSVEFIQANLYDYVMEYGRYCYATHIAAAISTSFMIWVFVAVCGGALLVGLLYCEADSYAEWGKLCWKWLPKAILGAFFLIALCGLVWTLTTTIIPYAASPEIWSITQAIELIK